jgi:hypothetical protein
LSLLLLLASLALWHSAPFQCLSNSRLYRAHWSGCLTMSLSKESMSDYGVTAERPVFS